MGKNNCLYALYCQIDEGYFSRLRLSQDLNTGAWFATKIETINHNFKSIAQLEFETEVLKRTGLGITSQRSEDGATFYNVMSLIKGRSLDQENINVLDIKVKIKIFIQLARSLKELHEARIIHGDLNENNIMVNSDTFQTTLVDFGHSVLIPPFSSKAFHSPIGKGIQAPELTRATFDPENPTFHSFGSDIHSFGIIMLQQLLPETDERTNFIIFRETYSCFRDNYNIFEQLESSGDLNEILKDVAKDMNEAELIQLHKDVESHKFFKKMPILYKLITQMLHPDFTKRPKIYTVLEKLEEFSKELELKEDNTNKKNLRVC